MAKRRGAHFWRETRRLDIELFAHVLADLDERLAALPTGARVRFMLVFDARQVLGQRLTTGTATRRARNAGRRQTFLLARQFGLGSSQIAGQGFLEQVALLGRERLAARAEAHPAQVRQLQREGLNLDLGGVKRRVTARDVLVQANGFGGFILCLIDEALNGADDPFREFWSGHAAFSAPRLGDIVPRKNLRSLFATLSA
jgi:hypothetical protein